MDRATLAPELDYQEEEDPPIVDGDVVDLEEDLLLLPGEEKDQQEDRETMTTTKASPQSRKKLPKNQNQTLEEQNEANRHPQVDFLDSSYKNCDGK